MYRFVLAIAFVAFAVPAFAGQEAKAPAQEPTPTAASSSDCNDGSCGIFRQRTVTVTNGCGDIVRSRCACRPVASRCRCAVRNTACAAKNVVCGTVQAGARIVRGTGRVLFGRRRCCN
jgi:hypothetical protein